MRPVDCVWTLGEKLGGDRLPHTSKGSLQGKAAQSQASCQERPFQIYAYFNHYHRNMFATAIYSSQVFGAPPTLVFTQL